MSLISLTDYRPMPRYDGNSWTGARIEGATDDVGPWSTIATVAFEEPEPDPTKPIERSFTVSVEDSDTAWLRVVFIDDQGEQDVANPVSTTAETVELAVVGDVGKRLGRYLTDNEEVQVYALIATATNNIYAAVDKPSTWVPPADVRDFLSGLCVELVVRSMMNPHGLASESETLGQHSVTQQYSRDSRDNTAGSRIVLNAVEELAARRIVYGTTSGSAHARSVIGTADDCYYADDIITTTPPTNGTGTVGPQGPAGPPGPQGVAGPQGAPGNTSLYSMWDYNTATTAPPLNGQIRTTPDPVVVGSPMTIFLSVRDSQGLYWDLPDVTPNDNIRLRGTSGAVQYCDVTAFENTVPGPDGYVTIQTMVTSLTGQIAKNAKVDVTLFKAAVV
jgi:hypothetical protein